MDNELINKFSIEVAWQKRIHAYNDNIQRWLDEGSNIKLTVKQYTSQNVEFMINDNPHHLIWYSQLSCIFLQISTLSLCSGIIKLKDGTVNYIRNYTSDEFATIAANRNFKVHVNPDGQVAKFDEQKIPYPTYGQCTEHIKKLVSNGKIEEAASYLIPSIEYSLEEV